MANIRAFAAYRPARGLEKQIAALPYDVYSREEAKRVVENNPLSFLAIDRAETQFPDDVGTYDDCVYEKAKQLLDEWIRDGKFVQDEHPCYYVYEQTMNGRVQTGIVACAAIEDYLHNVIKKHENTRVDKEIDRIRHVDTCNMQTGPIFLCYRNSEAIDQIVRKVKEEEPDCSFCSDDGIRSRVWTIGRAADIEAISEAFAGIDRIYIADGHHRCASAVKVGLKRIEEAERTGTAAGGEEYRYFLSVLFPKDDLMIMDYNRVVRDLNGLSESELLRRLAEVFEVQKAIETETPVHPRRKGEFGLYLQSAGWHRLTLKDKYRLTGPVESLDVYALQEYVLAPVLGITNPKEDNRIGFVGGIRGLEELERMVDGGSYAAAFSMYPTSMDELFAVADAGALMPPKSTWFEPKLLSGLFLHELSPRQSL